MNKKQLAVAITCALCASVSQVSMAGTYDVDITSDPTNVGIDASVPGEFTGSGENANLSAADIISAWNVGDNVAVIAIESGATSDLGTININTDLELDSSADSSLLFFASHDININNSIGLATNTAPIDLTFFIADSGAVNLNTDFGAMSNVTIVGDLVIGDTGSYSMLSATDSLAVDTITDNSTSGGFTYDAGSLWITNGTLNFNGTGLLGANFILGSDHDLHTAAQTVGTADVTSGSVTQNAGSNEVDGNLTINAGGEYAMNGGNLKAGQIIGDGTFTYTDGGVRLTASDMTIADGGLLGVNLSIDAGEVFGAVNQTIGVDKDNVGTVTQNDGSNTVDQVLAINEGSSYTQSGGDNTAATLNVNAGGSYALNGGSLSAATTNNSGTMTVANVMSVATTALYNLLNGGELNSNRLDVNGAMSQQGDSTNLVTTDLNINDAASYTQTGGTNTASTVNVNTGATYDISGGSLTSNGALNVAGTLNQSATASVSAATISVDGGSYAISGGDVITDSMNVGNDPSPDSGTVTQTGGNASITNTLTINNGGRYDMDGGNLSVANIAGTGIFDYTDGGVRLTNDSLSINSNGLLGAAINIDAGDVFGSLNQTIGEDDINTGSVTQAGGENTTDQALTINDGSSYSQSGGTNSAGSLHVNAGGSYAQSGGSNTVSGAVNINASGSYDLATGQALSVGSLQVDNLGAFSGAGTVTATGDITDLRTAGTIDASYSGANVSVSADIMNGAINATESIALDSVTVNGDITGTAMDLTGGSVLAGAVNLKPYVLNNFYDYSVINSVSGNNVISGNVAITPLLVDRHLGTFETVDSATIDVQADSLSITGDVDASQMNMTLNVAAGSSLSLQGNSTSALALSANVGTGGSLLLGNTTATNFTANGAGSFNVNGALTTGDVVTPGNVTIQTSDLLISGASGAVATNGGAIIVGTDDRNANTAQLIIDNSVAANSNRIGDNTDIQLSTGSSLTINGHATDAVAENAGSLIVNYLDYHYLSPSSRDFVANVDMNAAGGSTQIAFDNLQIVAPVNSYYSDSDSSRVNRVDFTTNGSFGANERILFDSAPVLTDGLMSNATINGQEFVAYDNALGIKSATTAANNFVAGGNIYINSNTALSANTSINSLAVTTANVTGAGTNINLNSGKMLLSGTSIIDPAINFGSKQGQVLVTGDSTLAGGASGTNGMFVNGGGRLELGAAGSIAGEATVNYGELVLSADNAIQGSDLVVHDRLDIGATTQSVNSMTIKSYGDFSGSGSVMAEYDILDSRSSGTIDANYYSDKGDVRVYADVMNGDISAGSTVVDGAVTGGIARLYDIAMNGNTSARIIDVDYATINGNLDAEQTVSLYSTVINGVISGAANLSGYATLTNLNTYTGTTNANLTLRGNGSIANSSSIIGGSINMISQDGDVNVDRIGDTADIALNYPGRYLNLTGSGTDTVVSEDVGVINVTGNAEVNINLANSLNGTTTLTADDLAIENGSLVFLSLGDSSQFMLDTAPVTVGSTNVLDSVYVEKDINGYFMPTWTTYDSVNGVVEAVVSETSINAASSGQFIRVTNASNAAMTANKSVGAINVDTNQLMSGAATLTVESGQMMFWKDNTVDIAQIDFGAEQGFISNAGTNTISSVLSGTNGLRKIGQGKLILTAANTYSGTTLISNGEIKVLGSIGDVDIGNDGTLSIVGTGQVGNISNSDGYVRLVNNTFVNNAGNTAYGYGSISADSTSTVTNYGDLRQSVSINGGGGTVAGSNSGTIYSLNITGNRSFTNTGTISYLYNNGTFNNSGSIYSMSNSRVATNSGTATNASNAYNATFTNNGSIDRDVNNSGNFTNNTALTFNHYYDSYGNVVRDDLNNNSTGKFTNNSSINIETHGRLYNSGTFINEGSFAITDNNNATEDSGGNSISGTFVNKQGATLALNNSDVSLNGTIENRGSVNITEGSNLTGTGTYRQLWASGNSSTTVVNGRVETDVEIIAGELSGAGYIAGNLTVGPNGTVRPGNSPGLLTVDGDFTLEQGADLIMEITWDQASNSYLYDELSVVGNFSALGNIEFDLGTGVDFSIFATTDPATDPVFSLDDFFTDASGASLELAMLADSNIKLKDSSGTSVLVSLEDDGSGIFVPTITAVPVPAAVWLFGSGLIGLFGAAKRRKAA